MRGATRAFWTDVRRLTLPLERTSAATAAGAAEELDRLSTSGVDRQVAEFSRELSVLYRRYAEMMKAAENQGGAGQGFTIGEAEVDALFDESSRLAKRRREIDQYVRDTYHY